MPLRTASAYAAMPLLAAQLTNDRATRDTAGRVRFVALLALEELSGESFGVPADAAVERAREWAARNR